MHIKYLFHKKKCTCISGKEPVNRSQRGLFKIVVRFKNLSRTQTKNAIFEKKCNVLSKGRDFVVTG